MHRVHQDDPFCDTAFFDAFFHLRRDAQNSRYFQPRTKVLFGRISCTPEGQAKAIRESVARASSNTDQPVSSIAWKA